MLSSIGGRFSLQDVDESHLDFLYNFRVSGIRKWFFDDRVVTWPQHLEWFRQYTKSDDRLFIISDSTLQIYVGTIGFIGYYKDSVRLMEFGRFGINNKSYIGKGYGTLILQSLFNCVFTTLGIEAIILDVIAENRIVGLYSKLGFVVNGFTKDFVCYPGRAVDKVSMILRRERFYENGRY